MHEIITLQLGQRANYLATHFWNVQESYFTYDNEESPVNHDVHFRPGVGADGSETYTPRTLIYDLKGAFGTLRKYNALYELSEDAAPGQGLWDGKEVMQQQTAIPQSEYQKNLDAGLPAPQLTAETVRYWSDYNRLFYHPRSIVQLNDYELNSKIMPFEDWNIGEDLFNDLDKEHDLLDRDLRPFAEECDQMRAIQLFTGSDDAWGGFAARYVDRIRDEYGKKAIWIWAIENGATADRQSQIKREVNKARSTYSLSPQSSLYTPIIDPPTRIPDTIHLNRHSEWYTSALLTSAIESITLPTRLRTHHDFEASLAGDDSRHKIFELQSTIVQDEDKYRDRLSHLAKTKRPTQDEEQAPAKVKTDFDIDFTYDGIELAKEPHIFNQLQVSRGIKDPSIFLGEEEQQQREEEEEEDLDLGLRRKMRLYNSQPMFEGFQSSLQFPVLDSFPQDLFAERRPDTKVSVLAALTASSRTAERIKGMETVAGRAVGVDEREDMVNGLGEIRELYEEGWMSESDFDDE